MHRTRFSPEDTWEWDRERLQAGRVNPSLLHAGHTHLQLFHIILQRACSSLHSNNTVSSHLFTSPQHSVGSEFKFFHQYDRYKNYSNVVIFNSLIMNVLNTHILSVQWGLLFQTSLLTHIVFYWASRFMLLGFRIFHMFQMRHLRLQPLGIHLFLTMEPHTYSMVTESRIK